jgi:hypothetical protein
VDLVSEFSDLNILTSTLVAVSQLAFKNLIQSFDINPFTYFKQGGKAVDAIIVTGVNQ